MSIKETLKTNNGLRRLVKRAKNYIEYMADARDFSSHYAETMEKKGDFRYRLMLLVHNIEKGMCYNNPRPFGLEKVKIIISILKKEKDKERYTFEYRLAKAALIAWKQYYMDMHWDIDVEVSLFIDKLEKVNVVAGSERFKVPIDAIQNGSYANVILSRRSVRDFLDLPLKQEDIDFALDCFLKAPTACNRQMCKVYQVASPSLKKKMSETILGIGGFNIATTTLFVFTYDLGAFEFYGERNQGYVNVGLTAMNFANGLHSRGIGSCFMQWSNNRKDDKKIRKALRLPERERIGLVVGAGYYKDDVLIPCSARRKKEDIYSLL